MTAKDTLKQWFSNLKKPTQAHFWAWIESYWHKSEKIPMQNIDGLDNALKDTVSNTQFQGLSDDFKTYSTLLDGKVDKESDKGLSANDFTNELKNKLETLHPAPMLGHLQFQNDNWGQVGYNDGSGNGVSIHGLREVLQDFDEEKAPEREQKIDEKINDFQTGVLSGILDHKLEDFRINTVGPKILEEIVHFQNNNLSLEVERIMREYIDKIMTLEGDIMQLKQEMETLKNQTENQQSEIDFLRSSLP